MRVPLALAMLLSACGHEQLNPVDEGAGAGSGAGGPMHGAGGNATGGASGTAGSDAGSGGAGAGFQGWQSHAPLEDALQENAVVALGGEIVVLGGFDDLGMVVDRVEAYDPDGDSWRSLAPLPSPRHHTNAATVGGKIYVLGALLGPSFIATGQAYVYDPGTDMWTPRTAMPAGTERGASAVAVIGDKIYVAGGWREGVSVSDFSSYDVGDDDWQILTPLPAARDHLVGGSAGGKVYAIGGRIGGIVGVQARVDVWDGSSWASGADMLTGRGGCAAATLNGRIYVFGGEGNPDVTTGVFPDLEVYDAAADEWTALPPMPTPRHGTGAAVLSGTIYVPGGATRAGLEAVAVHESYAP